MTAESIDIAVLSAPQKIALMERLWRALSQEIEAQEPPAWHAEVLAEREAEWCDRNRLAEDWPTVREELRRELP